MDNVTVLVPYLARAISSLYGSSTVGELAIEAYKKLVERVSESKKDYEERTILDDTSPIKRQRTQLIRELNSLQNDILITVSEPRFLARLLPMVIEQMSPVYTVQTEQELGIIELNVGQIRGYLGQYKKLLVRRAVARWAAIIVSVIIVLGLIALMVWSGLGGPNIDARIPLLDMPLPILLWSTIGSFTAILYRFNNSGDIELQDPLRWLFTRPLTGVVMGMVTYYVFLLGLLTLSVETDQNVRSPIIFWLIAFLSSFSDKFVDGLLHSLVGKFGGDANDQLISLDYIPLENTQPIKSFIDNLPFIGSPKQDDKPPKKKRMPKQKNNSSTK